MVQFLKKVLTHDAFVPDAYYSVKSEVAPKGTPCQLISLVLVNLVVCVTAFILLFLQSWNNVQYITTTSTQAYANPATLASLNPPVIVDSCQAQVRFSGSVGNRPTGALKEGMDAVIASITASTGDVLFR